MLICLVSGDPLPPVFRINARLIFIYSSGHCIFKILLRKTTNNIHIFVLFRSDEWWDTEIIGHIVLISSSSSSFFFCIVQEFLHTRDGVTSFTSLFYQSCNWWEWAWSPVLSLKVIKRLVPSSPGVLTPALVSEQTEVLTPEPEPGS